MRIGAIKLSQGSILLITLGCVLYLIFTNYPLLFLTVLTSLVISLNIVAKRNQPGIVTFIFLFQWLQIAFTLFMSDLSGISISDISWTDRGEEAVFLSSFGLVILSLGFSVFTKNVSFPDRSLIYSRVEKISYKKVLYFYIAFFFLDIVTSPLLFIIPSLTQLLIRIVDIKIILLYLLLFISFLKRKQVKLSVIILSVEFILGFTGYFSGFKNIIFYCFIFLLPFIEKVTLRKITLFIPIFSIVFFLAVSWQAVKGEYRFYLNQGTKTQTVQVSKGEALSKVQELYSNLSQDQITLAYYNLLDRIAYTKFLANALEYVPYMKTHENGDIWLENFTFAAVPRFINPDKGIKDDSQKVNRYTKLTVSTRSQGTSISLGYFADAYIDFGKVGMMFMIFFIGLLMGALFLFFFKFVELSLPLLFGFLNVVFFDFHNFGNDGVVVAGLITINLVYYYLIYRLILKPIDKAIHE